MKKIVTLFFLPFIFIADIHSQNLRSSYTPFSYSVVFFPDMKYAFDCLGTEYSRDLKKDFSVTLGRWGAWRDFERNTPGFEEDPVNFGKVYSREYTNTDLSLGYYFSREHQSKEISLSAFAGPSYLTSHENILTEIDSGFGGFYGSYTEHNLREFGINAGANFTWFPQKNIGIGLFVKGRAYPHAKANLSLGASVSLRLSNLHWKIPNTHQLENHLSLFYSYTWFTDWKFHTEGLTLQYTRDAGKKYFLGISAAESFRYLGYNRYYDTTHYGDLNYRNRAFFDLIFGRHLFNHLPRGFSLNCFAGPSFIIGSDWLNIEYPDWGRPVKVKHSFGITTGASIGFFPIRTIGIGAFVKGHTYLHQPSDLSVGASLTFRWSGIVTKRKSTLGFENHISFPLATTFFPGWKTSAMTYGFSFGHDIAKKFFLDLGLSVLYGQRQNDSAFILDYKNYGKVIGRHYLNFDASFGRTFENHLPKGFSIALLSGISLLEGDDTKLSHIRWDYYGQTLVADIGNENSYIHPLGINAGVNINYFLWKRFGASAFAKGRYYSNGQVDLTTGAGLIWRFSDRRKK